MLYDCHSIRSDIPFLFEGQLPVFSIGTNSGASCANIIEQTVHDLCKAHLPDSTVLNGRFKGGWTTRHYGRPAQNQHAIQMELAQRAYMTESTPWAFRLDRAKTLRPTLGHILTTVSHLAITGELNSAKGASNV